MNGHQARQEAARLELIAAVAQLQRTLSRTLTATLAVLEAFGTATPPPATDGSADPAAACLQLDRPSPPATGAVPAGPSS